MTVTSHYGTIDPDQRIAIALDSGDQVQMGGRKGTWDIDCDSGKVGIELRADLAVIINVLKPQDRAPCR